MRLVLRKGPLVRSGRLSVNERADKNVGDTRRRQGGVYFNTAPGTKIIWFSLS